MTCKNNNSSTARRKAGILSRCFGGKTGHRGRRHALFWFGYPATLNPLAFVSAMAPTPGQITMGQHHQRNMTVQSSPESTFIVVQSQFALGILVEPLDDPPAMGQGYQVPKRQRVEPPSEKEFRFSPVTWQGALADKPPAAGEMLTPETHPINPHPKEPLGQLPFTSQ